MIVNAKYMNTLFPNTFQVPSEKEIDNIKINDFVKICYGNERFWVKVIYMDGKIIYGAIKNNLIINTYLNYNDIIVFNICNIYSILKNF